MKSLADLDSYKNYFIDDNSTEIPAGAVKVTFLGTTTLLIDDGETQLMTDGFLTRPSFFKVAAHKLKTDTSLVNSILSDLKIDRLKAVFVAHSHYDHSMDAAYLAKTAGSVLYGSDSTLNIGRGAGLGENSMALYEPDKEINFGKFSVTILKSKHSPMSCIINDVGKKIKEPLKQPATAKEYAEGGSFDMLVKHGGHSILIKPSCNFIEGALDNVKAEILFLGMTFLAKQDKSFQDDFYNQTIGKVNPSLVIPIHWDNIFKPLSEDLEVNSPLIDDIGAGFDYLIKRTASDKISFKILQGYKSVLLFTDDRE